MTQLSSGSATMMPMPAPCAMMAVGKVRSSFGKPFVGRMQRHRISRPLAGAERDAAGNEGREPDRPEHRELGQCPDEAHDQQRPARLHPIDDKAGHDRREREQQEETRAEQPELARAEIQLAA